MRRGIMLCVACAAIVALAAAVIAAEKAAKPDFKKMDSNGDNKVVAAEFDAYVVAYPELGLTKIVFQEWDVSKDGTVTLEEFEAWQPTEKGAKPAEEKKAEQKEEEAKK